MRVAAYQAPLIAETADESIDRLELVVRHCELNGVSVLCFPETILGGLADFSDAPNGIAIRTENGDLASALEPLASETVTCIVGFTELSPDGALYNAAAVYQYGRVAGLYRKLRPAIRRSVYRPGSEMPVFRAGDLNFGILICNDSNDPELGRRMAAKGVAALFIPTNNSLPVRRASMEMNRAARSVDVGLAIENRIWVIRADVAGQSLELSCFGCSEIVNPRGSVLKEAHPGVAELLVAEIDVSASR